MNSNTNDIFGDTSSSDESDCHPYCWHCHVNIDDFNRHPYFVDAAGFRLCTKCYGDEHYAQLDVHHE